MPYAPQFGGQMGPPVQQNAQRGGFHIPVLSAGLVVLYLIYVAAMVLAPYFIEPYGKVLDGLLSPLIRLIISVVLLVVFGALMFKDLFQRDAPEVAPPMVEPQVPRAAPLGGGPSLGGQTPRFTPVPGPTPGPIAPPQAAPRIREVERAPSAPTIFTYPQEVEGGIYGDTYVQISPSKIIRIRSLIVDKRYMS